MKRVIFHKSQPLNLEEEKNKRKTFMKMERPGKRIKREPSIGMNKNSCVGTGTST